MSALPQEHWTEEHYLAFERESELKHEFYQGELFAMAGASEAHILLVGSTQFTLYTQLRKRPCKIYTNAMRVKIDKTRLYTYPDVVVVCGTPQFTDDKFDTLTNPTLIIEVLSPSTEGYDRGKKFEHYRTLASVQEYLLISQDRVLVEQYIRDGAQWLYCVANSLEASLEMPSIECRLALAEVYERITFEEGSLTENQDSDL